jgi:hypothetical protein
MTTFYDHDETRVTERWLDTGGHRYAIAELRDLRVARGPVDPLVGRTGLIGALALVATVAGGALLPPLATATAAAVTLLAAVVAAALTAWLRSPVYTLLAEFRGSTVELYRTRNRTEFGKVSRSVARAGSYPRRTARFIVYLRRT